MSSRLRSSKYRHVFTNGPKADGTFINIVPYPGGGDHQGIKCNTKYWATGVKGGGGPVLVWPFDKPGVVPTEAPRMNGHTADVLDIDFHPFYQDLLVTGGTDAKLNLWKIPEGGPVAVRAFIFALACR
jgi:coronin-1B/1C/6